VITHFAFIITEDIYFKIKGTYNLISTTKISD